MTSKEGMRCPMQECNKKLTLAQTLTPCGISFCSFHADPSKHACAHDYKGKMQEALKAQLSDVEKKRTVEAI